mgnify:CR=1 FL=1
MCEWEIGVLLDTYAETDKSEDMKTLYARAIELTVKDNMAIPKKQTVSIKVSIKPFLAAVKTNAANTVIRITSKIILIFSPLKFNLYCH